ncbi:MAG: phosphate acyltransferase PlsX, partial [Anaerolineales bacterium]|nr:phosphate acyltransferase PlsX [Anaerolineales bacterium]MDW8446121.1 phosphate acyltransferase PlsX [Anaerolineales bacterium]
DAHPDPEIRAAIEAGRILNDEIFLVGPKDLLETKLKDLSPPSNLHIVHASQVLEMTDKPAESARSKTDTSMAVGMELVRRGEADVFVTAGNTGGAMATALFQLRRIRGVRRPALTAQFPVRTGHCIVLDIGANTDCKPEHLLQFAIMGCVYAEKVLHKSPPRVALLSNGEETGKGNQLIKETSPLLKELIPNFIGNVEPKELFNGEADVVVTDGFTGNILLKSSEAAAKFLSELLRAEMLKSTRTKLGALLAKPAFVNVKKIMDPGEVGAAPLLGVNGLVFIGHGRSDAHALVNAIRVARQAAEAGLLQELRTAIAEKLAALPSVQSEG